ncbi:hypothetical protein AAG906_004551 [Vitis piasezkii]
MSKQIVKARPSKDNHYNSRWLVGAVKRYGMMLDRALPIPLTCWRCGLLWWYNKGGPWLGLALRAGLVSRSSGNASLKMQVHTCRSHATRTFRPYGGLYKGPDREFHPHRSLQIPGKKRRGRLVEWVEKLYVLPILPHLVPKVLVPASTTEKKYREGTLRQAPSGNRLIFSSTIIIQSKRKTCYSTHSKGVSFSSVASIEPDSPIDSSFIGTELQVEVESVVPHIVCEEEREEDMATNLRT